MVSGLVTSPCDQLRIFSGDARLIRIASKSATGFARSKGLERNKVVLRFLRSVSSSASRLLNSRRWSLADGRWPKPSPQIFGSTFQEQERRPAYIQKSVVGRWPLVVGLNHRKLIIRKRAPQALVAGQRPTANDGSYQSAAAAPTTGFFSPALINSTSRQSD